MGATKEDLEQIESIKSGDFDADNIEEMKQRLSDLKEGKETENPAYMASETRVFKGRFAPIGSVFLVVSVVRKPKKGSKQEAFEGTKTYTIWQLIAASGMSKEDKQNACFNLYTQLKEKYKL